MLRLTRAQVREIDRLSIEQYHIPGIVLMENAACGVADAVAEKSVRIVCGGGNNGGDGLAVARHLHNRGVEVELVVLTREFKGDAAINFEIAKAMGLLEQKLSSPSELIVDAIFGTGLDRPPAGEAARHIDAINRSGVKVLAIDVPSGLDCDTGEPLGPCVRATRTVTFVAEKAGFANPASKQFTGEVTIGDIGCPRELIDAVARESR